MKKILPFLTFFCFYFSLFSTELTPTREDQALGFSIKQRLEHYHFNRHERVIDDAFSEDAFELLLKRIDLQKRLFIQKDIDAFVVHKDKIDDELKTGRYKLLNLIASKLDANLDTIQKFCTVMLDSGFDFDKKEKFETDPEKMLYAKSFSELKNRWKKQLKYQCINRYISLVEKEAANLKLKEANLAKKLNDPKKENDEKVSEIKNEKKVTIEEKDKPKDLRLEAREKIKKNINIYFKRLKELKHQEHFSRYFNAVTATYDPHTNYMDPKSKEDFDIHMKKSLEGIGAVLQEDNDFTKVVRIVPGSASHRQGELEAEDIILRVSEGDEGEEVDITGMRIREVVGYIRGPKGTKVNLTVKKPNNDIKVISIIRDLVKLEGAALARSTTVKIDNKNFGYVYLPDFYRDFSGKTGKTCTKDVQREILKLKKANIHGLIFDLRGNGGGALEDARTIAGLFIESGPIVQVKDSFGYIKVLHDKDRRVLYDGPLVIMVDQFSASASEILAAAMQDYNRAVIVGSSTHGKGTVQQIISLETAPEWGFKFGSIKLTIQKFYRINGGSTQNKGVHPDVLLPDERAYLESEERYLDHALIWDKIPQQKYRLWKNKIDIPRIVQKSSARVKKSHVFQAIQTRYSELKKEYDRTEISLSMEDIKKDRKRNKDLLESFNKTLHKLKGEPKKETKKDHEKKKILSEKEIKELEMKKWVKGVRADPYVLESINILKDIHQ